MLPTNNQFTASLWGDEAFSAILSMKPVTQILSIISRDTSPPLYNLVEHFWFSVFGTSEVAIRALSFLFFSLSVFFVYKIGSLLWNRKTGLFSALLTFFNPFFFTYAFEGRMYSIMSLGVVASSYFFLKILYKKSSTLLLIAYALAIDVALYSHHFAIFAVLTQGVWTIYELFFGKRDAAIGLLKAQALAGILYLPWIIPLYNQVKMVSGGFWLGKPTLVDLRNLIYKYLGDGKGLGQYVLYLSFIVLLLRNWFKDIKKTAILFSLFAFPILITWAISQKFTSVFYDRYLLYTIPAGALLLSSNLRPIGKWVIVALICLLVLIDYEYFITPTKRPFRELATYVKQNQAPGDYLINWNSAAHHLWESKYYGIPAPIYIPVTPVPEPFKALPYYVGTALMEESDIIHVLPGNRRLGVITSGSVAEVKIAGYTKADPVTFGPLKFIWLIKKR